MNAGSPGGDEPSTVDQVGSQAENTDAEGKKVDTRYVDPPIIKNYSFADASGLQGTG